MTSTGYDHVFLSENSGIYFGIQFKGYYMITMYKTRPFGFKSSVYVYHSLGYYREIGRLIDELEI